MPNRPVRVVAHFAVQPSKVEEFTRVARESLVAPTLGEPGCIEYELCQDLAESHRFTMIETWESEQALQKHLSQPSLQAAVGRLAPMATEPVTVQRLRPLSRG